jgi:hypothetical protein
MEKFQLDTEPVNAPHSGYNYAFMGSKLEGKAPYFLNETSIHPAELLKLRLMQECTSRYFVSLALAKKSPYTRAFNEAVVRLMESGIVQHWTEDRISRIPSPIDMKVLADDEKDNIRPEPLRLENLQGAFLIIAAGFFLASAAFTIETSVKLISSKRSKYHEHHHATT